MYPSPSAVCCRRWNVGECACVGLENGSDGEACGEDNDLEGASLGIVDGNDVRNGSTVGERCNHNNNWASIGC